MEIGVEFLGRWVPKDGSFIISSVRLFFFPKIEFHPFLFDF